MKNLTFPRGQQWVRHAQMRHSRSYFEDVCGRPGFRVEKVGVVWATGCPGLQKALQGYEPSEAGDYYELLTAHLSGLVRSGPAQVYFADWLKRGSDEAPRRLPTWATFISLSIAAVDCTSHLTVEMIQQGLAYFASEHDLGEMYVVPSTPTNAGNELFMYYFLPNSDTLACATLRSLKPVNWDACPLPDWWTHPERPERLG